LNGVFRALEEKNIKVLSMRNKVNRLEELFVRLLNESKIENKNEVVNGN